MNLSRLLSVYLFYNVLSVGQPSPAAVHEFCNVETFNPNCSHSSDHVVVMETSHYGMMRLGKCLKVDYSKKLGCKADVLWVMDRHCSGKVWCEMKIPNEEIYALNQCPQELTSYLEASFSCVKVEPEPQMKCESGIHVKSSSGFISSIRSEVSRCKYIVSVRRGQKINLTLYDFFHYQQHHPPQSKNILLSSAHECIKYVTITEPTNRGQSKESSICGGGLRFRTIYLSDSNSIDITIFASSPRYDLQPRFLLKFDAVGCPDLDPSSTGSPWTVQREGDKAIISCNSSLDSTKHQLLCQGNHWSGEIPSCSARTTDQGHGGWGLRSVVLDNWTSSQGLVTVIILGVVLGVVLGVIMLVPLLFYFKRRDLLRHRMLMMTPSVDGQIFDPNSDAQTGPTVDKSTFALNQHLHGEREPCSWYTQDGSGDGVKTSYCVTSIHQIPQQTLLTTDTCWSHCPPRHLVDKNNPQNYIVRPSAVDYLEHDYDCPK